MTPVLKTSQARLWKLIDDRCKPDANVDEIDRRIWDLFGERWAVMFTDLAGFSRRVEEFGIIHFLQVIHEQRKLLFPLLESFDGLLVKEEADSLLALFRNAERALDCAVAMQRACAHVNQRRKPAEQILLCVGLGFGQVLRIGDEDVWGKEVNSASRLGEDTARAGEVLLTAAARTALSTRGDEQFQKLDQSPFGDEASYRYLVAP